MSGSVRITGHVPPVAQGQVATVYSVTVDGQRNLVRGLQDITLGTSVAIIDHEAPLNVRFRYVAATELVPTGHDLTSWMTVTESKPIISDPIMGTGVSVTIMDWPEFQHERAGHAVYVDGSRSPVIIDSVERMPTSTIKILHDRDGTSPEVLEGMLADDSVVQIRPTCRTLPTVYASARNRTRRRFSKATDSAIVDEIELVHMSQPYPHIPATGNTLGDLHAAVTGVDRTFWAPAGATSTVYDSSRYEAFPRALLDETSGTVFAAWSSMTDHFAADGPSQARYAMMDPSTGTWSVSNAFGPSGYAPIALAQQGGRSAILLMTRSPYTSYISIGSGFVDAVQATPVQIPATAWGPLNWTFPGDLIWLPSGRLLATSYGGAGIRIISSMDEGATWEAWSNPITTPHNAGEPGPSEPTLTLLPDGRLLMLVRIDGGTSNHFVALWSSDEGKTWTQPARILDGWSGQPKATVMPDGSLAVTLRAADGTLGWAVGKSTDDGKTWAASTLSLGMMMYGEIVNLPDGRPLLVGSTQKSRTDADIWSVTLKQVTTRGATLADIAERWPSYMGLAAIAVEEL